MDKLMLQLKSFSFVVIAMTMAGCQGFTPLSGSDESGGSQQAVVKPYGTCDRKAVSLLNLCSEVIGADYDDADYLGILRTNCEATGGVFSTATCDRTGSVGTCVVGRSQSNEVHTTYYPIQYSLATAQADCASNGGEFQSN